MSVINTFKELLKSQPEAVEDTVKHLEFFFLRSFSTSCSLDNKTRVFTSRKLVEVLKKNSPLSPQALFAVAIFVLFGWG